MFQWVDSGGGGSLGVIRGVKSLFEYLDTRFDDGVTGRNVVFELRIITVLLESHLDVLWLKCTQILRQKPKY